MSRKKRLGVLRNTSDDDMTLGELMGLPDLSDDEATTLFLNRMPTGSAVKKYRERQLAQATANAAKGAQANQGKGRAKDRAMHKAWLLSRGLHKRCAWPVTAARAAACKKHGVTERGLRRHENERK